MNVLLTGSTGFLGNLIAGQFTNENLDTLSRRYADINIDLSQSVPTLLNNYNLVVHAAGKAHAAPAKKKESNPFLQTNVKGTENLLKGLEQNCPKSFIFISSVSVYGRLSGDYISENCPLGANDPYGVSKIKAEQIIQEWCNKNNVVCGILRLPLIAGPNPPGNLAAMIKGISKGYYFDIAGGEARKSMVLAEDVARILPEVAKKGGVYNLTDGYHPSFTELSKLIAGQLGKVKPRNISYATAKR